MKLTKEEKSIIVYALTKYSIELKHDIMDTSDRKKMKRLEKERNKIHELWNKLGLVYL